jgi:hypothetical protein
LVIVLALAAGLPLWQRRCAHLDLNAHVASLRARGEPVTFADLAPPPIPDDQNAAVFINRASAALHYTPDEERTVDAVFEFLNSPTPAAPTQASLDAVAPIIDSRTAVFAELTAARRCAGTDWKIDVPANPIDILLPHLNGARALSNFLSAAALLENARGNFSAAVEHTRTNLFLARATGAQGTLVCHLVSIGIGASAADRARFIARSLTVNESHPSATLSQVRSLIADLIDEPERRQRMIRAWQWARADALAMNQFYGDEHFWMRGAHDRAAIGLSIDIDAACAASLAPNYPAAVALFPRPNPSRFRFDLSAELREMLLPSIRTVNTQFRWLTDHRAAATALAIRLYALDHAGRLPRDLNALVPDYLPQLPADPFTPDNLPLTYRTAPDPILYSVGADGIDDGGKLRSDTAPPGQPFNEWTAPDAVYPLTKPPPLLAQYQASSTIPISRLAPPAARN